MATYVNDLRLTELATGEGSGTWGTTTNTNLELIGEALGYGTQNCFATDADATTTVADGASDPARSMYFKVTSSATLTATRTLTIAPNTVSRVMFIENATTGSQSITISQGSGANVTIATGKTAVVYLDGAGSGAAVVDAMALVDPGVTDTLAEVLTAGNTSSGTNIELTTTDKVQFRDSAIYLNSSADGQLDIVADTEVQIATTTVDLNGILDVSGNTTLGADVTFTGASYNVVWDSSDSALEFADSAKAVFGAGSDLQIYHDGSSSYIVDNGTGNLQIDASDFRVRKPDGSEAMIHANADGAVKLFYDGGATPKLATTATGIDVTGTVTADGLTVGDSSSSFTLATIQSSTSGESELRMGDTDTDAGSISYTNSDDTMTFRAAAAARMSLNSTGLDVTGTVTADGLTVDGNSNLTNTSAGASAFALVLQNQSSDTSTAVELGFDNTSTADKTSSLTKIGAERVNSPFAGDTDLYFKTQSNGGSVQRLKIATTGDISFYEDTGTTAKLFWDASAESLGIGTSSPATALEVNGDIGIGRVSGGYTFRETVGGGERASLKSNATNELLFSIGAASEAMRIDSSGNVGIGRTPYSAAGFTTVDTDGTNGSLFLMRTGGTTHFSIGTSSGNPTIKAEASKALVFDTASTERMRIDSSGNLGLGTTDPASYGKFVVKGAGNLLNLDATSGVAYQAFYENGTGRFYLGTLNGSDGLAFIDADGSSERMRIDSSGNLLVGDTSPANSAKLTVKTGKINAGTATSVNGAVTIESYYTNGSLNSWGSVASSGGAAMCYGVHPKTSAQTTFTSSTAIALNRGAFVIDDNIKWYTGANQTVAVGSDVAMTEKMRLTSDGNLLVGTTQTPATLITTDSTTSQGVGIADGYLSIARDLTGSANSGGLLFLNRLATDGPIADFRKDGASVGSIGSNSATYMYAGTGDTGILFNVDANGIQPWNTSTNANSDGLLNLGFSSSRFKDLYLSGGVYLGGTGAANKLDDYEEGTWTPSLNGVTGGISYIIQEGSYTIIGNIAVVTFFMNFTITTLVGTNVRISLPAVVEPAGSSYTQYYGQSPALLSGMTLTAANKANVVLASYQQGTDFYLYNRDTGGVFNSTSHFQSGTISGTVIYPIA